MTKYIAPAMSHPSIGRKKSVFTLFAAKLSSRTPMKNAAPVSLNREMNVVVNEGKHGSKHDWSGHIPRDLKSTEADRFAGFEVSLVDRQNSRPKYLGQVCAGVDRECDGKCTFGRREQFEYEFLLVRSARKRLWQPEEKDKDQQEKWDISNEFHICSDNYLENWVAG